MAAFTYDGLNRQGQSVHGEVIADNTTQAMNRLRENGIIVTEMKEVAAKKKSTGSRHFLSGDCMLCRCIYHHCGDDSKRPDQRRADGDRSNPADFYSY